MAENGSRLGCATSSNADEIGENADVFERRDKGKEGLLARHLNDSLDMVKIRQNANFSGWMNWDKIVVLKQHSLDSVKLDPGNGIKKVQKPCHRILSHNTTLSCLDAYGIAIVR